MKGLKNNDYFRLKNIFTGAFGPFRSEKVGRLKVKTKRVTTLS